MRESKYFAQLLLFALLISTLPILVLGTFSYWKASSSVLDKITKSTQQLLAQTQITAEQNIKIIEQSLTQFTLLPIIHKALQSPLNENQFQLVREVNQYIEYTLTKNLGIEDLYLVNIQNAWAIYPKKISPLPVNDLQSYEELHSHINSYPLLIENRGNATSPFAEIEIPHGLFMVKSTPSYSTGPSGMIIARIDYAQLKDWIAHSEKLGSTYILNQDLRVIGSNVDNTEGYSELERIIVHQLDHPSQGYLEARYLGETVYMFYQKSAYTHWTYLSVVPKALIVKESADIGWLMLITGLGIICIMLILSYKGSLKMYSPINNLYKLLPNMHESGPHRNEIHVIESSLMKMKQQITTQGKELHKFYVLKLLQGQLSQDELESKIFNIHPYFRRFERFAVYVIQMDPLGYTKPYSEADWDLLLFSVMSTVEHSIPETVRLSPVVINQSLLCLVGLESPDHEKNRKELLHCGNEIKRDIQVHQGITVSVGISNIFTKLHQAIDANEEGLKALKYRVRFGNNSLLFFEDVEPASSNRLFQYPELISSQLKDAMKLNDPERAEQMLQQFIQAIFQHEGTLMDYQMVLLRLLGEIMNLYHIENDNASMILHGQSLPKELLELQTTEDIHHWFMTRVIEPIMKLIQEKTNQQYKKISDEIFHIIESNTQNLELTLDEIGMRLSYSPAYLSQVFRKETGISFTDYVMQQRIQTAKQWLLDTDISVNEIAKRLNYTNAQNFIRSFKRVVGVTPGKYRSTHIHS